MMIKTVFVFCAALMCLSACVSNPTYREIGAREEVNDLKATDVNFRLSSTFYRDPPACVVVIPHVEKGQNREMMDLSSRALARYLGEKVEHVIFPRKAIRSARAGGFDLENASDRARLGRDLHCSHYAIARLYDLGDDYVGVFAKKHVGLRLDLKRLSDDSLVWQASHTVWRADGGLPISPLGAIGGLASATVFANDQEIMLSLIDDAMRRMVRTLPIVDL